MTDEFATKVNLDIDIIKTLNLDRFKNILVLTGSYYSPGIFKKSIQPLIKSKVHMFSGITQPGPTADIVYTAVSFAKNKQIDCILSVGGDAVMNCGRLVSLLLSHGGLLHDYLYGGGIGPQGITQNLIYHITVPTVSGAGAEISNSASFIMDKEMNTIVSPYFVPKETFIDPGIMCAIPNKLWATICFECFAMALEAYVSTFANATSDMFAKEALKGVIEFSPKLLKDTKNVEYIKQIEVAAINAFMAARFSSTGATYAIADVLSARFNLRTGITLAMVCGEICKRNFEMNREKYEDVLEILDAKGLSIDKAIQKIIEKLDIKGISLKKLLPPEQIDQIARKCVNYRMRGNPKMLTPVEIADILRSLP